MKKKQIKLIKLFSVVLPCMKPLMVQYAPVLQNRSISYSVSEQIFLRRNSNYECLTVFYKLRTKMFKSLIFLFCVFCSAGVVGQVVKPVKPKLLFLVAGQSNAVGQGNADISKSGINDFAFEYKFAKNSIVPLKDPVGEDYLDFQKANTGSAWPAFSKQLTADLRQEVIIVPAARNGSSCDAKAEMTPYGTWASSGNLFKNAILKTNAAIKFTGTPLSGIVWSQGERDANAINEWKLTPAEYEQSLKSLIEKFRVAFRSNVPFYIIQTGYYKNHPQRGFDLVRQVQQKLTLICPRVYIVYKDTQLFIDADKLEDGIHYNQNSLNKIGTVVAKEITKILTAKLTVGKLFSDHMVLQQGIPMPVWGRAKAGEKITISINNKVVSTITGADEKWMAKLPVMAYGGPYVLTIKSTDHSINIKNVMIGEVWLASGQSNMNFTVGRPVAHMDEVVKSANEPMIREFTVPLTVSKLPLSDLSGGVWKVCTPESVKNFSAVAYFFAKTLHSKMKVAVGIIHSSYSGTSIQSWMSNGTQKTDDGEDWGQLQILSDSIRKVRQRLIDTAAFGMRAGVQMPEYNDANWEEVTYPVEVTRIGPAYGFVWFRKTITLPENALGKTFKLNLGKLAESDVTWFNGTEVGRSKMEDSSVYIIPANLIKAGKNVIAVRLVSQWGNGRLGHPEDQSFLISTDKELTLSLGGNWRYNTEIEPKIITTTREYQNMPSALFNAMINPIIPYGIKGFLWYQGEGNANDFSRYQYLQPELFNDWRKRWGSSRIPFLFVQLPNLKGAESWPQMREAQVFSLNYPNTGMAVTIDVGDPYDVHPHNKQPVGYRLALLAENVAYHQNVVAHGPIYQSHRISGNIVHLQFKPSKSKLVLKEGTISGFEVAGEDNQFYPAQASLQDGEIILSSARVSTPKIARYAWSASPEVSLYNAAGLPAAPFRTDH